MAMVRYLVDDVAAAKRFYCGALAFVVEEEWGDAFAVLRKGALRLWVAGPDTSAAKPMPDGRKPVPGGWNRIVLEVGDLNAEVARLKAAGVVFRNDLVKGPGGAQVLIEDPSGNPIELFQPRQ